MRFPFWALFPVAVLAGCASRQSNYPPTPAPIYQQQTVVQPHLEYPGTSDTIEEGQLYRQTPQRVATVQEAEVQPPNYTYPGIQQQPQYYAASPNVASGNCQCPDDLDSAGRQCGARSAYSRSGGATPSCAVANTYQPQAQQVYVPPPYKPSYCGGSGYGSTSCITGLPKTTYVSGYYRRNGTYVKPHYRSRRR